MCAVALSATAQNEYGEVRSARAANRSVYGLRPTADGEHYTVSDRSGIVRHAYTDRNDTVRLLKTGFPIADYAFSPDEQAILFADARSVKPIYRHSYTADYWLAEGAEKPRKILEGVRDVSFSPDGRRPPESVTPASLAATSSCVCAVMQSSLLFASAS